MSDDDTKPKRPSARRGSRTAPSSTSGSVGTRNPTTGNPSAGSPATGNPATGNPATGKTTSSGTKRVSAKRPRAGARSHTAPRSAPKPKPAPRRTARAPSSDALPAEGLRNANIFDDAMLELEQQIDAVVESSDSPITNPRATRQAAAVLESLTGGTDDEPATGADYYFRQWGRVALRNRSERVDDFGLDRAYEARVAPVVSTLSTRYFRQSIDGAENIPATGRVLLVCNRGGLLPLDGLLLRFGLKAAGGRDTRWLIEDSFFHMPFVGSFLTRVGAVRACQPNAERLLRSDACVAVFPEGMQGVRKRYRQRYQLQRFGRGGYVRLALRTGATIVPVGIVGPEDAYPLIFRERRIARMMRLPFLPITPTFPLLGPLGVLPLPSRFRIAVGAPIDLEAHRGAADNELVISRVNESVRGKVAELVRDALAARGSAYRSS